MRWRNRSLKMLRPKASMNPLERKKRYMLNFSPLPTTYFAFKSFLWVLFPQVQNYFPIISLLLSLLKGSHVHWIGFSSHFVMHPSTAIIPEANPQRQTFSSWRTIEAILRFFSQLAIVNCSISSADQALKGKKCKCRVPLF